MARRSHARPRRIHPIFCVGDEVMLTQFIRLIVLYEDLRIEVCAASSDKRFTELEVISKTYRELYFARRALATLIEVERAIHLLNQSKAFKELKKSLSPRYAKMWESAVRFFAAHHDVLNTRRNAYGGHYGDAAAKYVFKNLHQDHVGLVEESYEPGKKGSRHVFKFAEEFVALAMTADRGETEVQDFAREIFALMMSAMSHSTHAVQVIAAGYIHPRFGGRRQ
jgi:hypothetical protein